jgi:hypothetical protein
MKNYLFILFISLTSTLSAQNVLSGTYLREYYSPITVQKKPLLILKNADALYLKQIFSETDLINQLNQKSYYLNLTNTLFVNLKSAITNGILTSYIDSTINEPMTRLEVRNVFYKTDTTRWTILSEIMFDTSLVKSFLIKEKWIVNTKESLIGVKITNIAPIIRKYDTKTGDYIGDSILFWINNPFAKTFYVKLNELTLNDLLIKRKLDDRSYNWANFNFAYSQYDSIDKIIELAAIHNQLFNLPEKCVRWIDY